MKIPQPLKNQASGDPEGGGAAPKPTTFAGFIRNAASNERNDIEQHDFDTAKQEMQARGAEDPIASAIAAAAGQKPKEQKQEHVEPNDDPMAEFDEDLRKKIPERPGKDKGTAAQFDYVKAQRDIAIEQAKRALSKAKTIAEKDKAMDELNGKLQKLEEAAARIPELEKTLKERESIISRFDLQYDEEFKQQFTAPIADLERGIDEILDLAGDEKGEVLSRLAHALSAQKMGDFMRMAAEAIEPINPTLHASLLTDLRKVRDLYARRAEALANHETTAKALMEERQRKSRSEIEAFISRKLPQIQEQARESFQDINAIFESDAMKQVLEPHSDQLKHVSAAKESAINAAIEASNGKIPSSAVQFMELGGKAVEMGVALAAVNRENARLRERIAELEKAGSVARARHEAVKGRPAASSVPPSGGRPTSLAEAYRQQYGDSD